MRKRRVILILFGVGLLVGVLVLVFRPSPEPEYGGKKLSQWLERYWTAISTTNLYDQRIDAVEAVRHMGTNAVPLLVEWMGYEQPGWKTRLYESVNSVLKHGPSSWCLRDRRLSRQRIAFVFLKTLGVDATISIPKLTRMLNDPSGSDISIRAASVMATITNAGLPLLLERLTNRPADPRLRTELIYGIAFFGTNARAAFPIVQRFVADSNEHVRRVASHALSMIDREETEKIVSK